MRRIEVEVVLGEKPGGHMPIAASSTVLKKISSNNGFHLVLAKADFGFLV